MKVQLLPISTLKPNPDNPRLIKDDKFKKLVASIQSLPAMLELRPIVVNAELMVLGGNMRLKACQAAGLKEVPVVIADALTEAQQAEFVIKDNVSFGEWEWDTLANEWDTGNLTAWGLDVPPVDVEVTVGLTDPDDVPDAPAEPITKRGDRIVLGRHTLVCGDCRDFSVVETLLAGVRINVAMTSPPYASQRTYDESSGFKPIPPDEYVTWYSDVAANIMAQLAPDGSYFCNIKEHCDDGQRSLYVKDLTLSHVRDWGWRFVDEFCWSRNGVPGKWPNRFKNGWEPVFHFSISEAIKMRHDAVSHSSDSTFSYSPNNGKSKTGFVSPSQGMKQEGIALPSNVLELKTERTQTDDHSAPYPVDLPSFFIKAYSDAGDVIFDPFMGSGTTLIAAEQEGRSAYGCEISPTYCDVIVRRWEEFTGQKAVRPASLSGN